jgi:hypothetical protein
MEKPKTTPKDFFLWAAAMVTLYGSIIAFINLFFGYINYAFPDAANLSYYNPYDSGLSYWMATLIIFGIAAIALLRFIHRTIEKDPSRSEIWVRRWALYLTLFIAGMTILGDLVTLLHSFLSGEDLTARFLLKVAVVFLVAAGAFLHFFADLRGYWATQPKRATAVAVGVGLLVILTIGIGFAVVGTPWQARHYRLDEQKVSDLQGIQSQIVTYWQQKQKLPAALDDLNDPLSYYSVPIDPQNKLPYEYQATGATSFRLCATFNAESIMGSTYPGVATPVDPYGKGVADSWQHEAGHQCFARTIDPERYPPFKN